MKRARAAWLALHLVAAWAHAPCPPDAVRDGLPLVQCDRSPPCVRWSYMTVEKCAELKRDESWPTYDEHIRRNGHWASMRHLVHKHLQNKRLFIVGDSISNLWYRGLTCEAARHGLTVAGWSADLALLRHQVQAYAQDTWLGEPLPGQECVAFVETNTTLCLRGWHKFKASDTDANLALADVLLVNYALHYSNMGEYQTDMSALMAKMRDFNQRKRKLAVFRETSAQLFPNGGAYSPGAHKNADALCAPMNPSVMYDNFVWKQNEYVRSAARAAGDVPVLAFYNVTLDRWNSLEQRFCEFEARKSNPEGACLDCTHLCTTPTFWAYHVQALYELLEKHM